MCYFHSFSVFFEEKPLHFSVLCSCKLLPHSVLPKKSKFGSSVLFNMVLKYSLDANFTRSDIKTEVHD